MAWETGLGVGGKKVALERVDIATASHPYLHQRYAVWGMAGDGWGGVEGESRVNVIKMK